MAISTPVPMAMSVKTKAPVYGSTTGSNATITASPAATNTVGASLGSPAAKAFVDNQVSQSVPTPATTSPYQADTLMSGANAKTPQQLAGAPTTGGAGSTDPTLQTGGLTGKEAPQTAYDAAMNTYLASLKSANALGLQAQKDQEEALNRGESLGFATGEAARVNHNNSFAVDAANNLATVNKEAVAGFKDRLPAAPAPFSLNPGETRYDASGKPIASLAAKPASLSEQYGTGSVGEYNFAKAQGYTGSFSQYQNEDANRKAKAAGSGGDSALAVAVLSNPSLWNSLTPSARTALIPSLSAMGFQPPANLTSAQQDDVSTMDTVSQLSNQVLAMGDSLKGVGAFGTGTISGTFAKLGIGTGEGIAKGQQTRDLIGNIKGTIAKLRGGTSFTPNEQALLDTYTPTINDSDQVIIQKLKDLNSFISQKKANLLKSTTAGASSGKTSNDPLGLGI